MGAGGGFPAGRAELSIHQNCTSPWVPAWEWWAPLLSVSHPQGLHAYCSSPLFSPSYYGLGLSPPGPHPSLPPGLPASSLGPSVRLPEAPTEVLPHPAFLRGLYRSPSSNFIFASPLPPPSPPHPCSPSATPNRFLPPNPGANTKRLAQCLGHVRSSGSISYT